MAAGVIGILIPVVLWLISNVWNNPAIQIWMWFFLVAGAVIVLLFFVHLAIELHQDKKIDNYYTAHKKVKIAVTDGYECGSCGNRKVGEKDTYCTVCGVQFEAYQDKTPQEIVEGRKR